MANITDAGAVAFCNQKARPTADAMQTLYATCKDLVNFWNANSISTLIPNTTDVVVDGAASDGRQPLNGIAVTAIVTEANAVILHYEASSNAVENNIMKVFVNGQAKF
jgi:hypothetical protein